MKFKRIKSLVISRKKWLRGTGVGRLLDAQGKMCCLGFACLAAGVPKTYIQESGMPSDVAGNIPLLSRHRRDSALSRSAAPINDDTLLNDAEREAQLTKLFAQKRYGVRLRFVS